MCRIVLLSLLASSILDAAAFSMPRGSKTAVVIEEVAEPTQAPVHHPFLPFRSISLPILAPCYPLSDEDTFVLVENFEIEKMMGRWFEGLASPGSAMKKCIVHEYKRLIKNADAATVSFNAVTTYRWGSPGPIRHTFGYALSTNNTDAMLRMSNSEDAEGRAFWIYKVGPESTDSFGRPQYEYAIVSTCIRYPVIVLVRDQETFKEKYKKEILSWLEERDFLVGENWTLVQPAYASCYYADSITENV